MTPKINILTLFPEAIYGMLGSSITGNALKNGIFELNCVQIRDFTQNKQRQVDDYPYGGGMGMLMQADPLYRAWESVALKGKVHTVLMSAQGHVYTQKDARRLSLCDNLCIVCGHYEGVDRRFIDECVDEEISIGDFVMTGGEIPALAVVDSIVRLLPGTLADESCYTDESHWSGVLEYPHYTRPEEWHGKRVPDVLLSGHRENIRKWRRTQALLATRERRPDMFSALELTKEDLALLAAADEKE
ncbi:MAG: tRNA (guanosine(37)-N1)-methyltransferase TrmD [Clostridiales bacterium]|nr:tRNA (guanosine(37)-N1)-methyltransferase TrmD [Clostridiales bacterium]